MRNPIDDKMDYFTEKTLSEGSPRESSGNNTKNLTFDEKLKMAIEKEVKLFGTEKLKIDLLKDETTKPNTAENITGESVKLNDMSKNNLNNLFLINYDEEGNLNLEKRETLAVENKPPSQNNTINTLKGKKIFKIKKYVKYNKFLQEICSDEEVSETEKKNFAEPQAKKISPFSKVNFSKLSAEEKDERLKNLAKLVKRLRRKVRNLENKVRFNASKLLNKHICNKLGINMKNKYLLPEFQFDFDKICKALKRVRNCEDLEYDDQKHLIENIINLIADDKLKLDSLQFRKIASIIRMFLPKEKVKYISKKDSKITISFPETEVYISNKEYAKIAKFKESEDVLRAVLGVYDPQKDRVIKVIAEDPCTGINDSNCKLMENNSTTNTNNNNNFPSFMNKNSNNILFNNMHSMNNINEYSQLLNNNMPAFQPYTMNHNNNNNINQQQQQSPLLMNGFNSGSVESNNQMNMWLLNNNVNMNNPNLQNLLKSLATLQNNNQFGMMNNVNNLNNMNLLNNINTAVSNNLNNLNNLNNIPNQTQNQNINKSKNNNNVFIK
jgi:hypothetical protein